MELRDGLKVLCRITGSEVGDAEVVLDDTGGILLAQDIVSGRNDPLRKPYLYSYFIGMVAEWAVLIREYDIKPSTFKPKPAPLIRVCAYGNEESQTKIIRLQMLQRDDGVMIIAVDEDGRRIGGGNILKFKPDGTLYRYTGMAVSGLKHDESGRIVESKEADL